MATTDFLPTREAELVTWSANFNTRITAAPLPIGLTAAQATTYDGLHDAFVAAYTIISNDGSRTPAALITKDDAKRLLIANARMLAGIIQKHPGTTDTQRAELGLTVPSSEPTPIPPPASAPNIDIKSVNENTVTIRLHDPANPTRRGKPVAVDGAAVFSFVGANPPTAEATWKFEGNTTRTTIEVAFPDTVTPGSKVWFTAFWFNERKQSGPAATAVGTNLPGGAAMAA